MLKTVGNPSTRFGDQTITNGNLVIGTAGNGIDFSINPTAPGATSELLDDYEEGTFTPTRAGATTAGTYTANASDYGIYTKIGDTVYFSCQVAGALVGASGVRVIKGLPFGANVGGNAVFAAMDDTTNTSGALRVRAFNSGTQQFWINISGSILVLGNQDTDAIIVSGSYKTA
jgi:hypothetical protein